MHTQYLTYWKWLVSALTFATLLKLYLALSTEGSLDVLGFTDFLAKLRELGAIRTYQVGGAFNNAFNHPPFMVHVLKALGFMAELTGVPFRFWIRLPAILADAGSFLLVWKLLARDPQVQSNTPAQLLLLALCPTSIMISGYHGNTDPLSFFFVLLSIYLIETNQRAWLAGLVLGMAMNVKVPPLIFTPAIFLYLWPNVRKQVEFFAAMVIVFLAGSLPYILQDPAVIAKAVFVYSSIYGPWGWPSILITWYPESLQFARKPYDVIGIHGTFATLGKWLIVVVVIVLSFCMNYQKNKPQLFMQCGIIVTTFLFITPGFGVQYLSWLIPFVVVLGFWPTLIFYATSAVYPFIDYSCWAFRTSPVSYCTNPVMFYSQIACWLSVILMLMLYRRRLQQ